MRPDNDEDVEADDKTEESRIDNVIVTVVKVADDLDEVEEEADDGQNKPGHHKSRLGLQREIKINKNICHRCYFDCYLPGTMDEHGGNDNVADADDQKNCQHGRRPWAKSWSNICISLSDICHNNISYISSQ